VFVGLGLPSESSELAVPSGPAVQAEYLRASAAAYEAAGFDAVLVGESSSSADAVSVATELLASSRTFGVVLSMRAGLLAPTHAARILATLDALHPGRIALHLPDVASDLEPPRDGDWLDRPARQRRRAEFAGLVRRTWTADRPIEHAGEFYRVSGAWSAVRPRRALPLWVSGASVASDELAARLGDVYLLPADEPGRLAARMAAVRDAAGARSLRFGLRLRPIVRASALDARALGERVLRVRRGPELSPARAHLTITGALPGLGTLVGTADDVVETLTGYRALGVDVFHLAGYEPLADIPHFAAVIERLRPAERTLVQV
jgi:alkanesulfonate monooxygenase